jgi:hypothetical protein
VHNSKCIHPNAWVLNSERTIDWNFKTKEHNRVEISNLIGTPTDWLPWNRILLDSNKHTFDDFQLKAHNIMASKLMPTILLFPTGNSSTMLEQPQLLSKLSNLCQASSQQPRASTEAKVRLEGTSLFLPPGWFVNEPTSRCSRIGRLWGNYGSRLPWFRSCWCFAVKQADTPSYFRS